MMARVSVPFTGGHYYGREERPNTELAQNSLSACRKIDVVGNLDFSSIVPLSAPSKNRIVNPIIQVHNIDE